MAQSTHVIIVGAGLSGSLLAWTLSQRRSDVQVTLLDSRTSPLAKTWSFHASDILQSVDLFRPLVSHQWSGYQVDFTSYRRFFNSEYFTVKPQQVDLHLQKRLGLGYRLGTSIKSVHQDHVILADGTQLNADCVVDARSDHAPSPLGHGYQKFVGLQCKTLIPHGLKYPILMDARVSQLDGYRFMYLLPLSEHEILIEDTRYSDTPDIDIVHFKFEVLNYADQRGWNVAEVRDVEQGALPIPFGPSEKRPENGVPRIGVGGGYFHPVTGYSFADSARLAVRLGALTKLNSESVISELQKYKQESVLDQKFFYLLNRMLFWAAEPHKRVHVFERFYGLPESLIQNFYKGQMRWRERLRVLSGKPPVPVSRALTSSLGWRIS